MKKKKFTHGGKRKNAGRKKGEPTKQMRVPISLMSRVKQLIKSHTNPLKK